MDRNLKVEFSTQRILGEPRYRRVFWRIEPSQLNWWQRIFNYWHLMKFVCTDGSWLDWFEQCEYKQIKEMYHTLGDMERIRKTMEEYRKERKKALREQW